MLMGVTAAAMLPKQARGTLRKQTYKTFGTSGRPTKKEIFVNAGILSTQNIMVTLVIEVVKLNVKVKNYLCVN